MSDKLHLVEYGSKRWQVAKKYTYKDIIVPKGYLTDGASIPRLFWPLIGHPLNGKHAGPATIHDYLYDMKTTSRKEADKIFLEFMAEKGVSWLRRHAMYRAVRLFSGKAWKRANIKMANQET